MSVAFTPLIENRRHIPGSSGGPLPAAGSAGRIMTAAGMELGCG
jgi:hypothetical protein